MTHPCQSHSCDGCGWCSGALNEGIPVCCLTGPVKAKTSIPVTVIEQQLDLNILRQAIATDQISQPTFSELVLAEITVFPIGDAPEAIKPSPVYELPKTPSQITQPALNRAPLLELPAESPANTDLFTPSNNRKEQYNVINTNSHQR